MCTSNDYEFVELVSPEQIDYFSSPKGRSLISLLSKVSGRSKEGMEHLLRTAERRSKHPVPTEGFKMELIRFGHRAGYIAPVVAEEIEKDELFWR